VEEPRSLTSPRRAASRTRLKLNDIPDYVLDLACRRSSRSRKAPERYTVRAAGRSPQQCAGVVCCHHDLAAAAAAPTPPRCRDVARLLLPRVSVLRRWRA